MKLYKIISYCKSLLEDSFLIPYSLPKHMFALPKINVLCKNLSLNTENHDYTAIIISKRT